MSHGVRSAPAGSVIHPIDLVAARTEDRDGVTVAVLSGEIDISNVGRVAALLTELPNLALGLVVDLRSTAYVDSSAISLLHDLTTRLTERAQPLVIVCGPESLPRRVLTMTGIDARAPVLEDVDEAVALVRHRAAAAV